jgi:hypothetical protein
MERPLGSGDGRGRGVRRLGALFADLFIGQLTREVSRDVHIAHVLHIVGAIG